MSQMVGADVAELRELAASFDNKAAALRTMESQLTGRIHSAPWHGSDVQYFQHNWNSLHRRTILNSATAITNAAAVLRANAEQQEVASDATFTGRVPTLGELRQAEAQRVQEAGGGGGGWGVAAGAFGSAFLSVLRVAKAAVGTAQKTTQAFLNGRSALAEVRRWAGKESAFALAKRAWAAAKDVRKGALYKTIGSTFGKFLGPVGIVVSVADIYEAYKKGDTAGFALGVGSLAFAGIATAVAFGAPALPLVAAVGVVWGVASLAYDHRETLMKAGSWVAEKVSLGVKAVGDGVKSAVGQVGQNLNKMKDAATGVINRLTNPLRSVFG